MRAPPWLFPCCPELRAASFPPWAGKGSSEAAAAEMQLEEEEGEEAAAGGREWGTGRRRVTPENFLSGKLISGRKQRHQGRRWEGKKTSAEALGAFCRWFVAGW